MISLDALLLMLRAVAVIGIIVAPGNIGQGDEFGGPGDLGWEPGMGGCPVPPNWLPPGALY